MKKRPCLLVGFSICLLFFPFAVPAFPVPVAPGAEFRSTSKTEYRKQDAPGSKSPKKYHEYYWGLGFVRRVGLSHFGADVDWISTVIPLLYFDSERFFLDGLEGGIKLLRGNRYRLDFLGRMRFVDLPEEYRDLIDEGAFDFGFRGRYEVRKNLFAELEALTDDQLRWQVNLGLRHKLEYRRLALDPFLSLNYKSGDFNDHYLGLDQTAVGQGFDLSFGLKGSLRILSDLYLVGGYQATWIMGDMDRSAYLDRNLVHEFHFGLAVHNKKAEERRSTLGFTPYLRVSHGLATPYYISEIFTQGLKLEEHHSQYTSLLYGHPIADNLLGLNAELYLTLGLLWHWSTSVQSDSQEFVIGFKIYFPFTWPTGWRFGFADGISYADRLTHMEEEKMADEGYHPSKLMNYLDISIDVNLGDLFGAESLKKVFLGYAIHHRCGMWKMATQFGKILGGVNYHAFYLQYHF